MVVIQYVVADDWQGLYVNEYLKIEGHDISMYQALNIVAKYCIGADDVRIEKNYVNQEWMEDNGNLPNKYAEIPKEMIECEGVSSWYEDSGKRKSS